MMKTLFLDLASSKGTLSCIDSDSVASIVCLEERVSDEELPRRIEGVLNNAGWTYGDIEHIACITGPGGFTSLRIVVAAANVMGDQLDVSLSGVGLWELYRARAKSEPACRRGRVQSAKWIHSTKRTHVFVQEEGQDPHLVSTDNLPDGERSFIGELIDEHKALVTQKGWKEAELTSLEDILPSFVQSLAYEKKQIAPWYGREG